MKILFIITTLISKITSVTDQGYPPQPAGYPPPGQSGYPPQAGYPPPQAGYNPPGGAGYPADPPPAYAGNVLAKPGP